ncbi:hypothetical protein B7494_g1982 [Chlorociboria aeruginascens]|nr:hypothetical protein B7494_g1982 [Chlorociboria aeruginascens]
MQYARRRSSEDQPAHRSSIPDLRSYKSASIIKERSCSPLHKTELDTQCFPGPSLNGAVDSTADELDDKISLPSSPKTLYHMNTGKRQSFDTSVRALLQSRPDSPIGGKPAAPMAQPTKDIITIPESKQENPLIKVSPPNSQNCEHGTIEASKSAEPYSTSHVNGVENYPLQSATLGCESTSSSPMVTAPVSPRGANRSETSETTFDCRAVNKTAVHDFATGPKAPEVTLDEGLLKTTTGVSSLVDGTAADDSTCGMCPPTEEAETAGLPEGGIVPGGIPGSVPAELAESSPGLPEDVSKGASKRALKGLPKSPKGLPGGMPKGRQGGLPRGLPAVSPQRLGGIPQDATGVLTTPSTPAIFHEERNRKIKYEKKKGKVKKVVRVGRRLLLRKVVLNAVIGRQLAGPTKSALKLISKGDAVPLPDVPVPVPTPVPVPVPAPIPAPGLGT